MANEPESKRSIWVVIGGTAAVVVVIAGAVFVSMASQVKSTWVYTEAMKRALADPIVRERLGEPIRAAAFPSGSVEDEGTTGSGMVTVRVSGPRGVGTLHAAAVKRSGVWDFTTLEVKLDERDRRINLKAEMAAGGP
jgi:hypothetical protein